MSAALCLTFALAGQCPPGYPAYTGYAMTGAYSPGVVYSGTPHYAGPSSAGYGYQSRQPATYGYSGSSAYGAQQTYGSGAGGYRPPQPQAGYGAPGPQAGPQGYGTLRSQGGPQRGNVVHMTDRARFEPALITINVGETVEWRNVSRHPHTVTADPNLASNPAHVVLPQGAQPIDSGEVPPGDRFTYTFRTPGIYYYVCLPHEEQGMVGIVVVGSGRGGGQQSPGGGQPGAPAQGGRSY